MITYSTAFNELLQLFNNAWNVKTTAIVGYIPEVITLNDLERVKQNRDKYWVRVSRSTVQETQSTISDDYGGGSHGKRTRTTGVVMVQLFGPLNDAECESKLGQLAEVARDAFKFNSTDSCIWFRDATIKEAQPNNGWQQKNVTATYSYDELTEVL
jgi:hypothetical protein